MRPRTRSRSRRTSCTSCRSRSSARSRTVSSWNSSTGRRRICSKRCPNAGTGASAFPSAPDTAWRSPTGRRKNIGAPKGPPGARPRVRCPGYQRATNFRQGKAPGRTSRPRCGPEKGGEHPLFTAGEVFEPDKKLAAAPSIYDAGIHVASGEGLSCQKPKFRRINMRLLASLLASFGVALLTAAPARAELVLAVNEGVTYYVTPSEIREKYKDLADLLGKHLKTTV